MARPPDGTVAQRDSRTALFAHISARLADLPRREHEQYFRIALGVAVGSDGARGAGEAWSNPRPADRRQLRSRRKPGSPALRNWVLIDEHRLGLNMALVRFPGRNARQNELLRALDALPGVRQVIETASHRDVIAVLVYEDLEDRQRLRRQLEEVAAEMEWEEVESETHFPTLATWRALTRRAAIRENLTID